MSDGLTHLMRDINRSDLLYEIKELINTGKNEEDSEVKKLIEEVIKIPRGYYSERFTKEELICWIKKNCEYRI